MNKQREEPAARGTRRPLVLARPMNQDDVLGHGASVAVDVGSRVDELAESPARVLPDRERPG